MSAGDPLAAVVVPTHDHAATLDLAVRSALSQTVAEIEVLVVGDGVGDDTRELMTGLLEEDARLRFLDLPKGPNHGEVHRGRVVAATRAKIACYLCDDDLLLPDHVESMAELLEDADLAQSQNGRLEVGGAWYHGFGDLSSPACREWVLRPDRNVVSLTGTAHTVAAYRRLPHGWRTTPQGRYPDHYMWQQFLAEPWVRAVTSTRVTALHFPSHLEGRRDWSPAARRAEMEAWWPSIATPEGRARFDADVRRAVMAQSTDEFLRRQGLEEALAAREEEATAREAERARLSEYAAAARETLAAIEATRTWRLRCRAMRFAPLRALSRAADRRKRSRIRSEP